jgi:hypothetical protein
MDIDMGMARIVMRVGRLCLQEYGMKMALHVKHKYLSWRIVAIATVTVTVTVRNKTKQNKIKIIFDSICFAVCIVFYFARFCCGLWATPVSVVLHINIL